MQRETRFRKRLNQAGCEGWPIARALSAVCQVPRRRLGQRGWTSDLVSLSLLGRVSRLMDWLTASRSKGFRRSFCPALRHVPRAQPLRCGKLPDLRRGMRSLGWPSGWGCSRVRQQMPLLCLPDLASRELNPFFTEPNLLHFAHWLFGLPEDSFDTPLTPWQIECGLKSDDQGDQFGRIDPDTFRVRRSVSTGGRLFAAPEWCETREERQRYQIGALLRFAIRGTTDFFARASNSRCYAVPRYARSISHWEQQRYSGFQGRTAFGPPWLPISSFMEDLLYDLLRWPGSGILSPNRSLTEIKAGIESRKNALRVQYGTHSERSSWSSLPPFCTDRGVPLFGDGHCVLALSRR